MTMLTNPTQDLSYQLAELTRVVTALPALRAQHRDLASWLTGWQALLTQAVAETRAGQAEGEDGVRQEFLRLAEALAQAATLTLARTRASGTPPVLLTRGPLFNQHLHAWHALRGARQGVAWSGAQGLTSGRLPILALTAPGERVRQRLLVDVLEAPALPWAVATTELNSLAEGLLWRA